MTLLRGEGGRRSAIGEARGRHSFVKKARGKRSRPEQQRQRNQPSQPRKRRGARPQARRGGTAPGTHSAASRDTRPGPQRHPPVTDALQNVDFPTDTLHVRHLRGEREGRERPRQVAPPIARQRSRRGDGTPSHGSRTSLIFDFSRSLMATFSPVRTCVPSLTLPNVPSPRVGPACAQRNADGGARQAQRAAAAARRTPNTRASRRYVTCAHGQGQGSSGCPQHSGQTRLQFPSRPPPPAVPSR